MYDDEPEGGSVALPPGAGTDAISTNWSPSRRGGRRLGQGRAVIVAALIAAVIALVFGGAYILLEQGQPSDRGAAGGIRATTGDGRSLPQIPLPPVEDFLVKDVAPQDAVAINARVPFSTEPNPAAAPFFYPSHEEDYERAVDCLAAAVWYEAGDDVTGQQAVAQVVINRARHPAFRPSICGVVFQGSERATGCQFTFTCDGSMLRRKPSAIAWLRAQRVARFALAGYVSRAVGHATHYHTNWVVPYWSASLDKIVMIGTHIFFRWDGWWGTPKAFSVRPSGAEAQFPKLAGLSPVHGDAAAVPEMMAEAAPITATQPTAPSRTCDGDCAQDVAFQVTGSNADSTILLVRIAGQSDGTRFPALASDLCGARSRCVVMGWTDARRIPPGLPASTAQLQSMDFHYLRDPALGEVRTRWNCARFAQGAKGRCLSHQAPSGAAP